MNDEQNGPVITGAVVNTGNLSGDNNCPNCGTFTNGQLGTNARSDVGYFNGVEIQFNIKGNLKGYSVSISRTKTYGSARNGVSFEGGTNKPDGPDKMNVQLTPVNGKIYSVDLTGFRYDAITPGTITRESIGFFTETATIRDQGGNVVSQYSIQWQSRIFIQFQNGAFQFSGNIGSR
ncbi:MAG: hypothetical protein HOP30_15885 [Cyclobacteriaceae bacterium]|nr:hypothetical protein [Cyclobacteriaceae bacterium]